MPTIKIPRSTSVSSTSRGRALFTNTRMGSIGSAISELGSVLTDVTLDAMEKRNKVVETDYITTSLIDTSEKATRLEKSMLKGRKDPKGFADEYIKNYDEIIKDQIDNAPTQNAKRVLKNTFTQNRINNFKRTFVFVNKALPLEVELTDVDLGIFIVGILYFYELFKYRWH